MLLPYISHFSVNHHFSLLKILSQHIIILLPITSHLYISLHTHIFPSQFIFNLSARLYTNISFPSSIFSPMTVHSYPLKSFYTYQPQFLFYYPFKTNSLNKYPSIPSSTPNIPIPILQISLKPFITHTLF